MDGTREWVAIGEADEHWGQRLVVVTTGSGDHAAILAQARIALQRRCGVAAKPKALVVLESIPRSTNGKVKYDLLRELVAISPRRLTAE
jgi:acyl-CoA synthetase (AMP-forming)/AMP-acid ligase II